MQVSIDESVRQLMLHGRCPLIKTLVKEHVHRESNFTGSPNIKVHSSERLVERTILYSKADASFLIVERL